MKFLIQLATTLVVCFVLQYFLPWWTMAIGACAISYVTENKGYVSFLAGFTGAALLWLAASFYIDLVSSAILTEKVNKIFPINVFLLTALTGGLTGGFASLTGSLLKSRK